jgi:hypothetical protein
MENKEPTLDESGIDTTKPSSGMVEGTNKYLLILAGVIIGAILGSLVALVLLNPRGIGDESEVTERPYPNGAPDVMVNDVVVVDEVSSGDYSGAKNFPPDLPEDSIYVFNSYSGDSTGYISLRDGDGRYDSLYIREPEKFEYINEDYIKYDGVVYDRLVPRQWVKADECSQENLAGCQPKRDWESLVSPYPLQVDWLTEAVKAESEVPAFPSMCVNSGYRVGTISNGILAGSPLYVQNNDICDMWCGGVYILGNQHYVGYEGHTIPVTSDNGFTIPDLATSSRTELVPIPGSSLSLIKKGTIGMYEDNVFSEESRKYLFTDEIVGDVYRDDYACFMTERPDHVAVAYSLELPFDYADDRSDGTLAFTKLDGTVNTEVYKGYRDYNSCLNVVDASEMNESELTKAGEFSNGVELYTYANSQAKALLDLYADKNTLASYESGQNKYSYEEFFSYNPYLYWKDPFGDWVKFTNHRFDTAAEKCKPVIYLYPQHEGAFTVKVNPNGGFTQTIPEYGDGWQVTATPDSKITDSRTGEEYPYLYWEGINTGIPDISEGWIVAKANVDSFLRDTLARLGLNEKEIADFKEYWVPRFREEGFEQYKIMFLPQAEFDFLSPLSVTGDEIPHNIIRVMMYAQPAEEGETLPEQILPETPPRYGFTVVEWGGAFLN